jgi:hypothetical protein
MAGLAATNKTLLTPPLLENIIKYTEGLYLI